MTVTSSIVCGRSHPYIMSPKMSSKPCWRRTGFPDSGQVVTGLSGCERIRASPRGPSCRIARHCALAVRLWPAAGRTDVWRSTDGVVGVHVFTEIEIPCTWTEGMEPLYGVEDAEPDAMECCSRQGRRDRSIPEGQCVARVGGSRDDAAVAR